MVYSFGSSRLSRAAMVLAVWLALSVLFNLMAVPIGRAAPPTSATFYHSKAVAASGPTIAPPEFFGIVGRDPWYDFATDPSNPGKPNLAMQEQLAQQMSLMGARWVRIEFHAENDSARPGGYIDFGKYDAFIKDIAPRYNLKVLALLGSGITLGVNTNDNLGYSHLNDPPDLPDGSNPFIRFFAGRVREIADYYSDKIAAYELLNEPNNWYGFKAHPENVAALMALSYNHTKPQHPNVKFILGATAATGDPYLDHVRYLRGIYESKVLLDFKRTGTHVGGNLFPFDGVAWHPYFASAWDALYTANQAIEVMRQNGDSLNKIWVTETGVMSTKDDKNCSPSDSRGREDEDQAQYLRIFYNQAASKQNDIAVVFWFKFEDFYVNNQLESWGLVHLESVRPDVYNPYGKVVRYKPAFVSYQQLARPSLPTAPVEAPLQQYSASNPTAPYYFPAVGHTLSGPFLNYWLNNGGLDLFGLPLTEPYKELDPSTGKVFTVQWFERERFEYHPENAGTNYEVLLGLLGNELIKGTCRSFNSSKPFPPPPPPPTPRPEPTPKPGQPKPTPPPTPVPTTPTNVYFGETKHNIQGAFKNYWDKHGGLAIFGYPISEEFGETNPADGQFYVVQYFERARFEYHPANKGTDYEVELGLLGKQAITSRFGR